MMIEKRIPRFLKVQSLVSGMVWLWYGLKFFG